MKRLPTNLAEKIVAAIMDVDTGSEIVQCTRVSLKAGKWPDNERDMGGLCRESLLRVVAEVIEDYAAPTKPKRAKK
jgi:hypothetical protein